MVASGVEEAEIDRLRMLREERKIDTLAVPIGAERIGRARPHIRVKLHQPLPGSRVKISVASGGRVSTSDWAWPCAGCASAWTAPALPRPLPPYSTASLLKRSR